MKRLLWLLLLVPLLALAVGTIHHMPIPGAGTLAGPSVNDISSICYAPFDDKFLAIRQNTTQFYVFAGSNLSQTTSFSDATCGSDLETIFLVDPYDLRGNGDVLMVHDEFSHSMCEYSKWGVINGNGACVGSSDPNACCTGSGTGNCRIPIRQWDLDGTLDTIDGNNEGIAFIPGDSNCSGSKHGGCFLFNLAQFSRTLERFKIDGSNVLTKVGSSFTLDSLCTASSTTSGDIADLMYDTRQDKLYVLNDTSNSVCVLGPDLSTRIAEYPTPGPVSPDASADYEGMAWGSGKIVFADDTGGSGGIAYWSDGARSTSAKWLSNAYKNRRKIVTDPAQIPDSGAITDFPLMVKFASDSRIKSMLSTGKDLIFTKSDGITRLDYDLESIDTSTGDLIAWVRIPSLSDTAATTIYMYYNNPNETLTYENENGTWPSSYVGVYHMSGATTTPAFADASGTGNNLTQTGTVTLDQAGAIGKGISVTRGSTYLGVPYGNGVNVNTQSLTVCSWVNFSSFTADDHVFATGNDTGTTGNRFYVRRHSSTNWSARVMEANPSNPSDVVSTGTWYRVCLSADSVGNTYSAYHGSTAIQSSVAFANSNAFTANFNLGTVAFVTGEGITGTLDEAWVYTGYKTSSTLTAELNSQSYPGTVFFTYSDEVVARRHVD